MKCFVCSMSLGQSSAVGSPVLVPFSRWSSEPSLAHCSPDSCPHMAQSCSPPSALVELPHRTPPSLPDRPVPVLVPLRRSESVGRRNLLRHPNPLPPLLPNRDSDYELEPLDRGRKRAIDNQYMFFWQRRDEKANRRSRGWKVLQDSRPDGDFDRDLVVHKTRGNRATHTCLNDTAGALSLHHDSCLPC